MDSNERSKVIAFDTLFCTNHIQMLKVILPYMDNQTQKAMAVYIKFLELNYTIEFLKKHPCSLCGCMEKEPSADIYKICSELLPYCTENEKKQLEQIRSILQSMEMYREMSKTMDMLKDFMPDISEFTDIFSKQDDSSAEESEKPPDPAGSFDMVNLLMNMLTPEQRQMYEMFGGNQHAE